MPYVNAHKHQWSQFFLFPKPLVDVGWSFFMTMPSVMCYFVPFALMPPLMNAFVSFSFLSSLASSPSSCQGDSVIWTTLLWHSSTHSSNSRCQWIDFACKSMYDYPIHKIPTAWGRSSIFWKSPRKKWRNTKRILRIASIITNEKGQVARVFLNQIFLLSVEES